MNKTQENSNQPDIDRPEDYSGSDNIACIVVTFNPDLILLQRQLNALPANSALIIVDNASDSQVQMAIKKLLQSHKRTEFVILESNIGLAAATNLGVTKSHRLWPEIKYLLILDQDSIPYTGSINILIQSYINLKSAGEPLACVGPSLLDASSGHYHGFHKTNLFLWKRVYPKIDNTQPINCSSLNGSGTLLPVELFLKLGGLDESLFIDHVDTEWSFRVQSAGYELYGIPNAVFEHKMGSSTRRIWLFGWHTWPLRAPERHYYLFRNAVILMRRNYVPRIWKNWAVIKLIVTACIYGLFDTDRKLQLYYMYKGVSDGIRAKNEHHDSYHL